MAMSGGLGDTMIIKLKVKEIIEKEFDVEFPIYRKHDITPDGRPSTIIYTRIDKNLRAESITVDVTGPFEINIEEKYNFDGSEVDYHLGRGIYKCSVEEFDAAVNRVKTCLRNLK